MQSPPLRLSDVLEENRHLSKRIETLRKEHVQELDKYRADLRDQFAMAALNVVGSAIGGPAAVANQAYAIADAMLARREEDALARSAR